MRRVQVATAVLAAVACVQVRASEGTLGDSSGEIVAWGGGQTTVPAGNNYTAISAGSSYSLALRSDGSLAAWGANVQGQTNVPTGTNYTAIAAGYDHGLALKSDGSLAAWGANFNGQTNVPAGTNYTAIAGGAVHSLALRSDGSLAGWGRADPDQTTMPAGTNYTAIAAGAAHSLALRSDGSLAGWGWNQYGQSAVPAGTNYTAIAGGYYHSLALKSDGSLAGWGWNNSGQAEVPTGTNYTAIAAGQYHSLALKSDGSLAGWGSNSSGQTTMPAGPFVAIAAGGDHNLALRARTSYDGDLVVNGPDNGIKAQLNRSITVAGNANINSVMTMHNSAVMDVAGDVSINWLPPQVLAGFQGGIVGSGQILARNFWNVGGTITTTGNLTLGSDARKLQDSVLGTINVGSNTVTIHSTSGSSADRVILAGGTIRDSVGLTVPNISGYGTIDSNQGAGWIGGSAGGQATIDATSSGITILHGSSMSVNSTGKVTVLGTVSPRTERAVDAFVGYWSGDVLDMSQADLVMEIGRDRMGIPGHDMISASDLQIGGKLDVSFVDQYQPSGEPLSPLFKIGDSYSLFSGPITGTFSQVNLPSLSDARWDTSQLYSRGVLSIAAVPEPAIIAMGIAASAGLLIRQRRNRR